MGVYRYNRYAKLRLSSDHSEAGEFVSAHVRFFLPGAVRIAKHLVDGHWESAAEAIEASAAKLDPRYGTEEKSKLIEVASAIRVNRGLPEGEREGSWVIEAGFDFGGTRDGLKVEEGEVLDLWITQARPGVVDELTERDRSRSELIGEIKRLESISAMTVPQIAVT